MRARKFIDGAGLLWTSDRGCLTRRARNLAQATTIYMTSGHGGCGPHGLARAAFKRGLSVRVAVNTDDALFIDSVRQEQKKEVMQRIQQADIDYLNRHGVAMLMCATTVLLS